MRREQNIIEAEILRRATQAKRERMGMDYVPINQRDVEHLIGCPYVGRPQKLRTEAKVIFRTRMGRIITDDIAEIAFAALTATTSDDPEKQTALQFYSLYPGQSCAPYISSEIFMRDSSTEAHQELDKDDFITEEVTSGPSNTLRLRLIPMPEILCDTRR